MWFKQDYSYYSQVELKGWSCAKKTSPTWLHHQRDKMLIKSRMDPDLYGVYAKFSPHWFHSRTQDSQEAWFLSMFFSSIFHFGERFLSAGFCCDVRGGFQVQQLPVWVTSSCLSCLAIFLWPQSLAKHFHFHLWTVFLAHSLRLLCPGNSKTLDFQ